MASPIPCNLVASDPGRILQLCSTLHDKRCSDIQQKINKYLRKQTEAEKVFIITILKESEEGVVKVINDRVLKTEVRLPLSASTLKLAVAEQCQKSSVIGDTQLDKELLKHMKPALGIDGKIILNVPVTHPCEKHICLVVCLVNYDPTKKSGSLCSLLVQEVFRYCLGIVLNTFSFEEELHLRNQSQSMLRVAKNLFSHLSHLSDLLRQIMVEARSLTNAERCSLFILDKERNKLEAKIFDGQSSTQVPRDISIDLDVGIAGHVAKTGVLLNIRNAYSHPLFYKGFDEMTGFKTRNILCFPIIKDKEIIGVAQLCNKKNGLYFDVFDEEVAMAFSVYCGISIMHSVIYDKIKEAQARNQLVNELMMYHMKVKEEDVKKLMECPKPHDMIRFSSFNFSPRTLPEEELPCYTYLMFKELNLEKTFQLNKVKLARFILFVKRGYRDVPYHNFWHAFSTIHFSFLLVKNLNLIQRGYITSLEALAFLVSTICHDLDHRATTNSFQTQSGSVLANLYSSEGSVMERHHFSQALCILSTEGCKILDDLPRRDYTQVIDLMRSMILATDLSIHFKTFNESKQLVNSFDKRNHKDRLKLLCLFMTACDLSDQTKDWPTCRVVADLVYKEFFTQGDMEKTMGGTPVKEMDREKAYIPTLQINFLELVAIPLFEQIAKLFPEAEYLFEATKRNRDGWVIADALFPGEWTKNGPKLLSDRRLDKQVMDKLVVM